jgi:hypothetical protein
MQMNLDGPFRKPKDAQSPGWMIQFFSIRHDLILTQGQLLVEAGDRQRGARIAGPFAAFALLLNRSMAISRSLSRKSPREALVNEHLTAIASRLEHARWQISLSQKASSGFPEIGLCLAAKFAPPRAAKCWRRSAPRPARRRHDLKALSAFERSR